MNTARQIQRKWMAVPSATILQVIQRTDEALLSQGLPRFDRLSDLGVVGHLQLEGASFTHAPQNDRCWATVKARFKTSAPLEDAMLMRKIAQSVDQAMDRLLAQPMDEWSVTHGEFTQSMRPRG